MRERRLGRRRVGQRRDERADPVREPAQDGVRERHRPLETGTSHELDRLVHRRVARDPVDERELIRAEAKRRPDGSIESRDPSSAERLDRVVERADALDRAVREPLGERAVAFVQPGDRRPESAVRVRVVLEDAQQDVESRGACRAYGRRPRSHASYAMRRPPSGCTSTGSNDPSSATRARQTVTPRPWRSARAPMCGERART